MDYGSTDNSKFIISSYVARDNRIKVHEVRPCVLPAARNAGCFLAQGRYIAIMDADDVWLPAVCPRKSTIWRDILRSLFGWRGGMDGLVG